MLYVGLWAIPGKPTICCYQNKMAPAKPSKTITYTQVFGPSRQTVLRKKATVFEALKPQKLAISGAVLNRGPF